MANNLEAALPRWQLSHRGASPSYERVSGPLQVEAAGTAGEASAAWSAHLLDPQFCLSLDALSSCFVSSVDKLSL